MDTACPPACLTLSLTLPLPSSPLQGTHMPVLQKKQVTLPEACEGFINVITVLTVSTSIHQFFCFFTQGRFAESACSFSSQSCCLSVVQLHMLKLEGCLLYSSSGTVWGSFVLFKGIFWQLLWRKLFPLPVQEPPAALQLQNSFFLVTVWLL